MGLLLAAVYQPVWTGAVHGPCHFHLGFDRLRSARVLASSTLAGSGAGGSGRRGFPAVNYANYRREALSGKCSILRLVDHLPDEIPFACLD